MSKLKTNLKLALDLHLVPADQAICEGVPTGIALLGVDPLHARLK